MTRRAVRRSRAGCRRRCGSRSARRRSRRRRGRPVRPAAPTRAAVRLIRGWQRPAMATRSAISCACRWAIWRTRAWVSSSRSGPDSTDRSAAPASISPSWRRAGSAPPRRATRAAARNPNSPDRAPPHRRTCVHHIGTHRQEPATTRRPARSPARRRSTRDGNTARPRWPALSRPQPAADEPTTKPATTHRPAQQARRRPKVHKEESPARPTMASSVFGPSACRRWAHRQEPATTRLGDRTNHKGRC